MDQSIYAKLNEAYLISTRLIIPPVLQKFRDLMIRTLVIPYTEDEFNAILEKDGGNTLMLKLSTDLNEKVINALNTRPEYCDDMYYNLISNIHAAAMDYLLKDNYGDVSQKLISVDLVKDKIDNLYFLTDTKPDKSTNKYFKILAKNKERLLNIENLKPVDEELYYWSHPSEKLKLLIDNLVEKGFIEFKEDYILTFRDNEMRNRPVINWVAKPPIASLILLFHVYGKSLTYKGESILNIAWKIFKLNQTTYNTRQYFNTKKTDFGDMLYISKKHRVLHDIIMNLEI